MKFDKRHKSKRLVDGADRAPARSYFKSVGYNSEDLKKPLVMVAHSWIGTMPCNFSHREIAQDVMAVLQIVAVRQWKSIQYQLVMVSQWELKA